MALNLANSVLLILVIGISLPHVFQATVIDTCVEWDPHVISLLFGYQQCDYYSPDWTAIFFTQDLRIDALISQKDPSNPSM